jgi:hypothetical protein
MSSENTEVPVQAVEQPKGKKEKKVKEEQPKEVQYSVR